MLRLSCVVHGPIGDLWPFYGLYCKRFFLYINVCYGNDRCFSHTNSFISNVMQQMPMFLNAYISSLGYLCSNEALRTSLCMWRLRVVCFRLWMVESGANFLPTFACASLGPDSAVGGKGKKRGENRKNIGARSEPSGGPRLRSPIFFRSRRFFLLFPTIRGLGPVNYRDFRETGPWFQAMLAPSPLSERPEGSRWVGDKVTLDARDFSSAVSGFCQVFIVTRGSLDSQDVSVDEVNIFKLF